MKNVVDDKKGITLIALIITIIVMLILVGVTINIALTGGLFEKARIASGKTQRETDREMLLMDILYFINNNGDLNISANSFNQKYGDEWEATDNGNGTLNIRNKKSENEFTLDKTTGKISDKSEENIPTESNILDGNYTSLEDGEDSDIKIINGEVLIYDDEEHEYSETGYSVTTEYLTDGVNTAPLQFIVLRDGNNNIINKIIICYSEQPTSLTCITTNQDSGTTHVTAGKYYLNGNSENTDDYIEVTAPGSGEFYDKYKIVVGGLEPQLYCIGGHNFNGYICINNNIYTRDGDIMGTYNQATNTIVYKGNNYTIPSI